MKKMTIATLAVCLLFCVSVPVQADETDPKEEPGRSRSDASRDENLTVRVVNLEYLDTKSAITVLRAIFQVRQIAEIRQTRAIVLRDDKRVTESAARLLKELDVPAPRWTAGLQVETVSGKKSLRTIDLESEDTRVRFGAGGTNTFVVELDVHDAAGKSLRGDYRIYTDLQMGERSPFHFEESGELTLGPEDSLTLVEIARPEVATRLGGVLGMDEAVRSISLVFHRL